MTLMELDGSAKALPHKAGATPKAILNQKYGNIACYRIEEVPDESSRNACPGLAIPQHGQSKFRCHLELPEFTIVSDVFTRKKDAEQSAAKMALEKLGILSSKGTLTIREKWEELVARLSFLFKDEFLKLSHPLVAHFKAALLQKNGIQHLLPASVLPVCDAKFFNLCKSINPKAEVDPLISLAITMKAARQSGSVCSLRDKLWISRPPYPAGAMQSLLKKHSESRENVQIDAIYIPCSREKPVEAFSLELASNAYYMDVIAQRLGVNDSSQVLISRAVGKSSSEIRLYFPVPDSPLLDYDSCLEGLSTVKESIHLEPLLNARASYFSGQNIYGNAVLATLGYTWRSAGSILHESVSLSSYYRMLLSRLPDGNYKISRDAILTTELPLDFTTRSNWRGSFPRDLLCMFCHQHHLSEPIFSISSLEPPSKALGTHEKLKLEIPLKVDQLRSSQLDGARDGETVGDGFTKSLYRCSVRVLSKEEDVIVECFPQNLYRSKNDAVQNAALKVLGWLNKCFKQFDLPVEKLVCLEDAHGVRVSISKFSEQFSKQIALYGSLHNVQQKTSTNERSSVSIFGRDQPSSMRENGKIHFNIEGPDSGIYTSNGSLVCIRYAVFWVNGDQKKCLESKEQFEFEIGTGSVICPLEECISQMSVNQVANFITSVPSGELILALAGETATELPSSSPYDGFLEYCIKLLQITEPMEDRMEQAFFNPPLSKQRLDYALRYIRESQASTLVDFGCGSGSLLDALFQHDTTLEEVAGVDISQKSLTRAAKMLFSNLSTKTELLTQSTNIKAAVLYEGSITEFDHRLFGLDVGTCLEVIEHMEEDQACFFGNLVLSSFCPHIFIVSTPNHEYNSILQRNATEMKLSTAEGLDEKAQAQPCRFRNHDHKFEWTRAQFNQWAVDLALRHNYSVEISGVGGSADIEPGFASQIAVFRRNASDRLLKQSSNEDSSFPYEVRWKWHFSC